MAPLSSTWTGACCRGAVTCVIPATSDPDHLRDNMQAGVGGLPDTALRARWATSLG